MIYSRFHRDRRKPPDHDGYEDQVNDNSVNGNDLQKPSHIHGCTGHTAYHDSVIGDEPARKRRVDIPLKNHVVQGKYEDMDGMDKNRDEPDPLTECQPLLKIKTSEDHEAHRKTGIEA